MGEKLKGRRGVFQKKSGGWRHETNKVSRIGEWGGVLGLVEGTGANP